MSATGSKERLVTMANQIGQFFVPQHQGDPAVSTLR